MGSRILACLFILAIVYADVEDHLRLHFDKSVMQSIEGVDFIYLINLDERPEKWQRSIHQLALYGIIPCRFPAVNGWKLSLDTINDVGLVFSRTMQGGFMGTSYHRDGDFQPSHEAIAHEGQTYFCHCLSRGAIGIFLSHLSILQDAWDSGYETIWIMEDDIDVCKDPSILSSLIQKLDACDRNWDILFTDRDIKGRDGRYVPNFWAGRRPDFFPVEPNRYDYRADISEDFFKVGSRSGAHSMIIRRCGISKLLQFCKAHQIFFPYDMEYILPPGISLYCVREDVISNLPEAPSDNGGPTYPQTMRFSP